MDNNGEDSPSEEFSMQMPAYEEQVNFESYTCASPSIFPTNLWLFDLFKNQKESLKGSNKATAKVTSKT